MCATYGCGCGELEAVPRAQPTTLKKDLLARCVGTQRAALEVLQTWHDSALANPTVRTVWKSSQPTHLVAAAAVFLVSSTIYNGSQGTPQQPSSALMVVYLLSLALHIGAQFWMTFVSGLTLYFSLSRHAFGDVQQVLFPRYFTFNSVFTCVSLLSFAKLHHHIPTWTSQHYTQVCCLGLGFLVEILARLYMAPRVLGTMTAVRQVELKVEGVGQEIGRHLPRCLAESPTYIAAYSQFRKAHSMMAMANILSIAFSITHLVYLGSAIQFK